MLISEIGENGLIQQINSWLTELDHDSDFSSLPLFVGLGDDAAAWESSSQMTLLTTDTLVEDVHFNFETMNWYSLGWKSLAVNMSDIAAMGGDPQYATVSLALPGDINVEDVHSFYRGAIDLSRKYGGKIVGGDVVKSQLVVITVSMIGITNKQLLLMSSANEGDVICVTGLLGGSAAGLKLLLSESASNDNKELVILHQQPNPRIADAKIIKQNGIKCATDLSDGLLVDLLRVSQSSGVGAVIYSDSVPVNHLAKKYFPDDAQEMALNGGEDYELLFCGPLDLVNETLKKLSPDSAIIGKIVNGSGVKLVDSFGIPIELLNFGWDHFQ